MNREPRVSLLPTQTASPGVAIAGICAANCVVSIVSTCLYYSELHHLHDFPFFAAQLNAAIGALLSGCLLTVMPKDSRASSCHLTYWFRLAALLSAQNSLEIVSIPRVGNDDLPPILQQAVVPLSLMLSTAMLRKSYGTVQLMGSAAVVAGVLIGFLPSLFTSDRLGQIRLVWVAVFLVSRLPQAAANVVAEGFLEGHRDFSWALRATLYTQLLGIGGAMSWRPVGLSAGERLIPASEDVQGLPRSTLGMPEPAELADISAAEDVYEDQASELFLPQPYPIAARMSGCDKIRATLMPWIAFVLSLSLFVCLYHDHAALVWMLELCCMVLCVLSISLGRFARNATLMAIGFLCLASVGLGAAVGTWLEAGYLERFWQLYRSSSYQIVNPYDVSREVDMVSFLKFVDGTVVDERHSLGHLARGSIYCVAPVVLQHQTAMQVLYWAVGKDCCGRRSNFSCGTFLQGIMVEQDDVFGRAVLQASSVFGIKAAATPRLVALLEHPSQLLAQLWYESTRVVLMAVLMHLVVCIIATVTMASATVYASKLKH
ncbi:Crt-like 3 [Symbiodinium microadriaticum]|uniref:Crt-like 3 n=1 Tax=Symbiodinium microadriaticum TaxID=2951 RepID=A0A1Q9D1U6_SYMMI|nr:Crt-like 3 [Symbiodinium microadriaticum]